MKFDSNVALFPWLDDRVEDDGKGSKNQKNQTLLNTRNALPQGLAAWLGELGISQVPRIFFSSSLERFLSAPQQ